MSSTKVLSVVFLCCFIALATSTLEDFYSFPNLNSLISSPSGNTIAWMQVQKGVPNVFIAERPEFSPKQCTHYTEDSGLDLSGLTFNFGGNKIFFTAAPSDGANPLFLMTPPVSHIVSIDTSCELNSQVILATDVALGAVSPKDQIAFTDPTGLGVKEIEVTANRVSVTTLFQLQSDQGYVTDLTYSPDGTMLAFTNNRGDHSFIGVFKRGQKSLQWISPSFMSDNTPVWSPDGLHIAYNKFQDVTDLAGRILLTQYSVYVGDVTTGKSTKVFEDLKVGFPDSYGYGVRPLSWLDSDTVAFPCEQTMWLHVCTAPAMGGGPVKEIVTGNCEVQDFIVGSPGVIYACHNCDMLDSLSVTRIDVSSGKNSTLFTGTMNSIAGMADAGFGMAPLGNSDSVAYLKTGYNTSTHVVLWQNGQEKVVSGMNGFDGSTFVKPQPIQFESFDHAFTIHGQLFMPSHIEATNPAVVFTHGGPMRQMYCAFHYGIDYSQLYALNQYLASKGYIVLSVNYRMGVGYGKAFRDCEGCGQWGAKEYLDVLGGNLWLTKQSYVDPRRIGIHGLSYGGLNCLQALSRDSSRFAVGVANAPVFNWLSQSRFDRNIYYDYNPPMPQLAIHTGPEPNLATPFWHDLVDSNMELGWKSSPAGFVSNFTSPILLIHGDSDRNVDVQETIGLLRALRSKGGVEVEAIMFPNERHGLCLYSNDVTAAQATFDFLNSHLNNKQQIRVSH